ncbi:MAG: 16S rRNA (cytosine(967)-C(5))-methyltransferase RsmB, partial [Pseudomonadota bacterium]
HLAALMGDQGVIVALDTNRRRLVSLTESCVRLGIKSISPVTADASKGLSGLFSAAFDRILIDAPCSGLGTLSRHPDGKWRRREKDIKRLVRLQREILRQAAPCLRKGGRMLYVTCTLSKEENEDTIRSSLQQNPSLALADLRDRIPDWGAALVDDQGFLRTLPQRDRMDGFFAALLTIR